MTSYGPWSAPSYSIDGRLLYEQKAHVADPVNCMLGFSGDSAFPDRTGSSDDSVVQDVETTSWSLPNGYSKSVAG